MMGAVQIFPSRPCPLVFLFTHAKCWLQMWRGKADVPADEKNICQVYFGEPIKGYTGSLQARKSKRVRWGLHTTWCSESRTDLWGGVPARCQKDSPGRQGGSGGAGFTGRALHTQWSFYFVRVTCNCCWRICPVCNWKCSAGWAPLPWWDSVLLQPGTIRRVNHTIPNAWHPHESLFCCHVLQFLPVLQYLGVCCPCDLPTALWKLSEVQM